MNKGGKLAGGVSIRGRVENDFYATPESSVRALLKVEKLTYPILEPACGQGHIAKLLIDGEVVANDLIDRGYGGVGFDFLTTKYGKFPTVLTNPPFNLFQEFVERALNIATEKVVMFGKLQALEGIRRANFLQLSPLRTVYVFKARQSPLRNGSAVDETGKPWASTMAFAWFVWEIGYKGKPQIEWI